MGVSSRFGYTARHQAGTFVPFGRRKVTSTRFKIIWSFIPLISEHYFIGATALIELGETERGLEWTQRALELDSHDPNVLYNAACAFSMSGELEEAISCLEKSLPFCGDRQWLEYDSYLDPLRSLPRFQELLRVS